MIGVGRELPDQSGYLFRTDAPAAPYVRDVTDERWHESARHYEAAGAPRSAHDPALHPDRRRDRGPRYFEALTRIAERYELLPPGAAEPPAEADPGTLIQDAIRWIVRQFAEGPFDHKARLLVRRLETVRDELAELRPLAETASEGS